MEIAEQTAWYEDGGKTRVTKTVYKSGTVSINKHFYHFKSKHAFISEFSFKEG